MRIQNVLVGGGGGIAKFQIYWGGGTSEFKIYYARGSKKPSSPPPPRDTFLIGTALTLLLIPTFTTFFFTCQLKKYVLSELYIVDI